MSGAARPGVVPCDAFIPKCGRAACWTARANGDKYHVCEPCRVEVVGNGDRDASGKPIGWELVDVRGVTS